MITVAGFNTAIDHLMRVDVLHLGEVNRTVHEQVLPGGKGLHVAQTVAALGEPVQLIGLIDAAHRNLTARRMSERGVAILMSTHTLEVAEEMCDRISIILRGQIIARGTVDELRAMAGSEDEQLTPVFLKLTGGSGLQEIEEVL